MFFAKLMGPKLTQAEGFVLGLGAKIFTVAGPVLLYGTLAGTVYGLVLWIAVLF
jgi:stage V sporulation protein AC